MIKQLSIKHYAFGFILLYILIFIGSSFYAYKDIDNISTALNHSYQKKGQNELIQGYHNLILRDQDISKKFSTWNEVHQQLDNTAFYSFWYTHRLFSANILPDYYQEIALYNKQGKILAKLSNTTLPEAIKTENIAPCFIISKGIAYLILTTPITVPDTPKQIRGYVMTKSRVISSLLKIKQFNYIESSSLKTNVINKDYIPVDQLINYLQYTIKSNEDSHIYTDFLKSAMIRNALILIGFALLFYFLISYFLSLPLLKISAYIDQLNKNSEFNIPLDTGYKFHIDELEKVHHSLTQYQNKLIQVHQNLDIKNQELWQMAHQDALTGVYNRRAFEEHWQHIIDVFSDSRQKIALLLFDINRFKSINDTYGHPVGDQILAAIAKNIQLSLRKGEKLYRIGGDEFASILQIDHDEDAFLVAERCITAIKNLSYRELNIQEPVSASIGISHNTGNSENNINDLLWQADVAVYEAKKPGQSHIIVYSKDIDKTSRSIFSSKINSIVYNAIETGQDITMFYQPIINLSNNTTGYFEALLRIKQQDELIPLKDIFELVEGRKLEHELDSVIFKAIKQDLDKGKIPENTGVSINVSGPSIINSQIVEQIATFLPYLKQYTIILEITETSLITNINQASDNINRLKSLGFLIALDDFGSGYSSISYLSSMPVDIVKFDISLIQQLSDKKQYSIINHLANMINETGHKLVAEGIETEAMHQIIKKMKFHYAQGFLFGKPSEHPVHKTFDV